MKLSLFKQSSCAAGSLLSAFIILVACAIVLVIYLAFGILSQTLSYGTLQLIVVLGFFVFVYLVLILSLLGVVLAGMSLLLREKRPLLAVLGLILNAGPLFLAILTRFVE
jgi:hypothetical protein